MQRPRAAGEWSLVGCPYSLSDGERQTGQSRWAEFRARAVANMGQRLSSRPGPIGARWVPDSDFFRLWFEMRVAAGAARAVMLICEGWVPQRRFFAAPGPQSINETSAPTVVGAHSYVAGPV